MPDNIVSGKTQVCGIIGDPIEHTISPVMHNAAFRELGMDYCYVPFHVKQQSLCHALDGIRALNIRGLNITIPHKVSVIPLLDELDSLVENLGAVNTITNQDGYLKGYNTDASGFWQALQSEGINPVKKKTVILGSGGAARAISFILADKGANLTILNRHTESARHLADSLFRSFRREAVALELNPDNLNTALKSVDILVNTTSVGMATEKDATPIPANLIRPGMIVVDIIYNPIKTRFLTEAEERGARIVSGLEMLVRQGAASFELWTGRKAPVAVMREAAKKALNK